MEENQTTEKDSKELFYNTLADDWENVTNPYDTKRRVEVIFDDFLGTTDLNGVTILDGGCGIGDFTAAAAARGAKVTAIDIADKLVARVQNRVPSATCITASLLELPFEDNSFDVVFSSDVIEHTPDPHAATKELIRVLKPGGQLCITVPNRSFWYFSVVLANWLKIRPFEGYENWMYYRAYRKFIKNNGIEILDYKGIHLYPFVVKPLNGILRKMDSWFSRSLGVMCVNLAVHGKKTTDPSKQ